MLYPMCFEYAEMVRFYHSVYRVVYHPQVIKKVSTKVVTWLWNVILG